LTPLLRLEAQVSDLGGAPLVVLAALALEVEHELELLDGERAERVYELLVRSPDDLRALAQQRRELDEHAPPVLRVGGPPGVAGALEAVDDGGHGGGRQAAGLREPARRDGALAIDDVQAAAVGP